MGEGDRNTKYFHHCASERRRHLINAIVIKERSGFKWRITGFYGHSETHRRKESWNFLDTLNNQIPSLLVVLG